MNKTIYWIKWKCKNCDAGYPYEDNLPIRMGQTIDDYSKKTGCPQCGCKGTIYGYGLANKE